MTGLNKMGTYYYQTCQYLATILRLSGIQPCQGGGSDLGMVSLIAKRLHKPCLEQRKHQKQKLLVLYFRRQHLLGHWRLLLSISIELVNNYKGSGVLVL